MDVPTITFKSLLENSVFAKIAYTVTAATIIGGGTMVMNNQSRIAVMESKQVTADVRLERIESKIDQLLERR
jgi:hypothetical protein